MPERDLAMDTLRGVLDGKILVHNHCYRADEMAIMIDMAQEFGYKITAFHHAVEAYKIADLLAANNVCAAMWADWYGFKMESYDAVKENIPLVHNAGACAIVHSDDPNYIQRLNQEAAKALADGIRAGIPACREAVAWEWLSRNPAKALGILDKTGTLKPGKMADVVLWNGDPFSDYTRPERVWIDGAELYDANNPEQASGQRLRARPAGRRRREVIRGLARRIAGGDCGPRGGADLCDRQRHRCARRRVGTDPGRDRLIRNGRIVAAGGMRFKLPADTQVIDATGKWVTPGIVAGFSRLGLAEVDLTAAGDEGGGATDTSGSADDTTSNGPFNAAIDVVPALNPLNTTIAVNRADGVTRALVAPSAGRSIFAGQGAVIDTGADMDPVTAPRKFQFVELGETGAEKAGGSRASAHVLFRNALREAAELPPLCSPVQAAGAGAPSELDRPIVRNPNESRVYGPDARRSEDVLLTRFDAAALVPVLQGRQYLLVHVERASDILQVLALKREFPVAQDCAGRGSGGLDRRRPDRRAGVPVIASAVERPPGELRADRGDPVERRPDAFGRRQGLDRDDRRQRHAQPVHGAPICRQPRRPAEDPGRDRVSAGAKRWR